MKDVQFIPYFIPRETKFHFLGVVWKLLLVLLYAFAILVSNGAIPISLYITLFSLSLITLRLPIFQKWYVGFVLLSMLTIIFWEVRIPAFFVSLFIVLGKIISLTLLLSLFSMTTRINDLLELFTFSGKISTFLNPLYYLLNTSLAVFPSVQYDLQRAIEAEEARRGRKVKFYSLVSLVNITIILVVRTLNRSSRFTQTVIDRGYSLETGLSSVQYREDFNLRNVSLFLLSAIPAVAIFVLFKL